MEVKKTLVLVAASVSVFFEALDIAIINLAMPLIQEQFQLTQPEVQWLQTLYVLVYGGFLILGGKLSDVYGRKEIFLLGSAMFLVTSLGAALSQSFPLLTICRATQGLAAALVMPSAMAIITNTFTEPHERSKAVAIFSSFAALGSGSGLSMGGLLATFFGWQSVFFINVPVIAFTLFLGYRFIPASIVNNKRQAPDILSGALITASIISLSYFVHSVSDRVLHPLRSGIWAFGSIVLFSLFIRRNKHTELIDFNLIRSRHTVFGNITMILMGGFFTSFLFVISLVLQNNMDFSPAQAGFLLLPFSILSAVVGKFMIPVLLRRLSTLQIAITGMSFMAMGSVALLTASYFDYPVFYVLLAAACVSGFGIAIAFTGLTVISLHTLSQEHHGLGSSINMTAYFFGAGLGLAILSAFMSTDPLHQQVTFAPHIILMMYAVAGLSVLFLIRHPRSINDNYENKAA